MYIYICQLINQSQNSCFFFDKIRRRPLVSGSLAPGPNDPRLPLLLRVPATEIMAGKSNINGGF